MKRNAGWAVVVLSLACASEKGAEKAPQSSSESTAPAAGRAAENLPAPGLAAGAWVSLDERGAYGPHKLHRLDVMQDDTVRCTRVPVDGTAVTHTGALSAADKQALRDALVKDATFTARPAPRPGNIPDIGTTTLSAVDTDGRTVSLVTDGRNATVPPQGDVGGVLAALMQRCLEGAP
ncbi:MAG: hypothetical protein HY904_05490 [Deltaproteobacteria bacterium]|nr:hypothetical protein [Deltaproteobacteria bacterium]